MNSRRFLEKRLEGMRGVPINVALPVSLFSINNYTELLSYAHSFGLKIDDKLSRERVNISGNISEHERNTIYRLIGESTKQSKFGLQTYFDYSCPNCPEFKMRDRIIEIGNSQYSIEKDEFFSNLSKTGLIVAPPFCYGLEELQQDDQKKFDNMVRMCENPMIQNLFDFRYISGLTEVSESIKRYNRQNRQ